MTYGPDSRETFIGEPRGGIYAPGLLGDFGTLALTANRAYFARADKIDGDMLAGMLGFVVSTGAVADVDVGIYVPAVISGSYGMKRVTSSGALSGRVGSAALVSIELAEIVELLAGGTYFTALASNGTPTIRTASLPDSLLAQMLAPDPVQPAQQLGNMEMFQRDASFPLPADFTTGGAFATQVPFMSVRP